MAMATRAWASCRRAAWHWCSRTSIRRRSAAWRGSIGPSRARRRWISCGRGSCQGISTTWWRGRDGAAMMVEERGWGRRRYMRACAGLFPLTVAQRCSGWRRLRLDFSCPYLRRNYLLQELMTGDIGIIFQLKRQGIASRLAAFFSCLLPDAKLMVGPFRTFLGWGLSCHFFYHPCMKDTAVPLIGTYS